MKHRISRKLYNIFAFDIETHNDEESIAKRETSMWLGCLIDEKSKIDDESSYFYNMDSVLDKLEELSSPKRKRINGKEGTKPTKNVCLYIYNTSFEWSFMLPYLLKRGFTFKENIEKDDEFCFNSVSTRSVSSVWLINLKFHKNSGYIIIRDLAKIFGGGLGKVAKAFNLPTQKGEIDYRLNRLHGHIVTKDEKEYCFKDTRIIIDILLQLFDDKDFWNSCSMASYSMRKLLKSAFPRSTKPYQKFRELYPELDSDVSEFLRNSVGGGLTYATEKWQYVEINQKIGHIDAHQMHPTQMAFKMFPYGEGEYFEGEPTKFFKHINCCHVLVSYDDAILHSSIKLLYNNHMVTNAELWIWDFEIPTMRKIYRNLEITFIDGYCFKSRPLPWRRYIKDNYAKRKIAKAEKNDFYILYYKLLNNSSYGKFLEKPHNEIFVNMLDAQEIITSAIEAKEIDKIKTNAKYTYIPVGSCIPAYSRVSLIETALKFCKWDEDGYPIVDNILYFDTDSIFFLWNEFTESVWKSIPQEDELGNWGWEEMIDRAQFTAPKRYKTETDGKATIKAGGINFTNFKAQKIDEMIMNDGLDVSEDERKEMIENYMIPFDEVNIISSSWKVQRAYRVKGGTIIEFQDKEISIPSKYLEIYNKNVKMNDS